ncbi:hypothetical protein FTO74_14380 [Granulicella sp. WH15]|uniref:hypothetical protein n=1 Tax=Granulicella sp. WH15 TaxID=2602070 RepID=UPI0013669AAA|nr:hypothetical protein [Granulicella sp. WH15]QHN04419.1 hypothetical protein FTO74_14380 [Granulicella sp. WH15]
MSKLTNQWVDLFEAGNYGDKGEYSSSDIDQIIANYDPAHHEAPVVIGHPATDAPAYAWVESLRRVGAKLQGKFKQIVPAFEEAVEAGRYKKRSVSLYSSAKGFALRHVGFLGGSPPEVKGLADIKFENEDSESVEIEFAEEKDMATEQSEQQQTKWMEGFIDSLQKRFPGMFGAQSSQANFSEADVKRISGEVAAAAVAAAVAPLQAKLDSHDKNFTETKTASETAASKTRAANAISGLKSSGKWVPAFDRDGLTILFDELAKAETVIEFGEGDKKKKQTPLEILVTFMESFPQIVPAGRAYTGHGPGSLLPAACSSMSPIASRLTPTLSSSPRPSRHA